VNVRNHFFVDPTEQLRTFPYQQLLDGSFVLMSAPSQSGKSTNVMVLKAMLNQTKLHGKQIMAIVIDMGAIVRRVNNENILLSTSFIDFIESYLRKRVDKNMRITTKSIISVFNPTNGFFGDNDVVLLLDEFSPATR
jgi:hypothetical protein